jgi:sucrose phosphorylase
MIDTVRSFGGLVNMRAMPDGSRRPYEANITYFDAMKGTVDGPDEWQFDRFICSQTIQMALEGIPAFYIHSLLGTGNDYAGVERTGQNRTINRKRWDYPELRGELDNPDAIHARARAMKERIRIRSDSRPSIPTPRSSPCIWATSFSASGGRASTATSRSSPFTM